MSAGVLAAALLALAPLAVTAGVQLTTHAHDGRDARTAACAAELAELRRDAPAVVAVIEKGYAGGAPDFPCDLIADVAITLGARHGR